MNNNLYGTCCLYPFYLIETMDYKNAVSKVIVDYLNADKCIQWHICKYKKNSYILICIKTLFRN